MSNKFKKLLELHYQIENIEDSFTGAEIEYKDYFYAMIEFVEGKSVHIYCEDEEGQQYHIIEDLEELSK